MISPRIKTLLIEASKCFDEGYSPFNSDWLSEHEVTLDECVALSSMIGMVIRGVALANDLTQAEILLVSSSDGKITSENARASFQEVRARRRLR